MSASNCLVEYGRRDELLSGELGEPALDLIDPRRRRRREMHMIVRPPRQPVFDRRCFVGGVIVHDDVNIEAVRNLRVDLLEELQETRRPGGACSICRSRSPKRCRGRQTATSCRGGYKMGPALRNAGHHRQDRLLAIERLYLALLIDAEHQRPVGRRQIKADDVADLVDEQGSLESLNVSERCGCKPKAVQILRIVVCENPVSAAIERIDQCVASLGVERRVRSMTVAT